MTSIERDSEAGPGGFLAGHGRINTGEIAYMVLLCADRADQFRRATRVESVDPSGAVVPIPAPQVIDRIVEMGADCDTNEPGGLCSQCPLYSSVDATLGWLAEHPGGRVFSVREAWDLSFYRERRERMSALLELGN